MTKATNSRQELSLADKLMLSDIFRGMQYEFIVSACDNHYKLKQVATECLQWFRAYDKEIDPSRAWHYKELKKQINQAIKDCGEQDD